MTVDLLTEHHLEFLNLKAGCTDLSESIHVKMPQCLKSHVAVHLSNVITRSQNECAPSEDPDQSEHLPSLIRFFSVQSVGKYGYKLSFHGQ